MSTARWVLLVAMVALIFLRMLAVQNLCRPMIELRDYGRTLAIGFYGRSFGRCWLAVIPVGPLREPLLKLRRVLTYATPKE